MSPRHVSSSLLWLAETSSCCVSPRCHLWSMANRIVREVCPPDIPRVSQHLMLWRWYRKLSQVVAANVPQTKRNQNMCCSTMAASVQPTGSSDTDTFNSASILVQPQNSVKMSTDISAVDSLSERNASSSSRVVIWSHRARHSTEHPRFLRNPSRSNVSSRPCERCVGALLAVAPSVAKKASHCSISDRATCPSAPPTERVSSWQRDKCSMSCVHRKISVPPLPVAELGHPGILSSLTYDAS